MLNQDIPESELEIICVNDGSPDNSADIAREIAEEHPCIIVIDQENQGPSGARNTGMRHATGKYLCFVDPDDYVEPNVYGGLIKQMEEQQLDMLRFNYQIVDEQDQIVPKRGNELTFDYSPQLMTGAEFITNRLDIACNIWRYIYRRTIITDNNIWCFVGDYYDDTPWLPLVLMKAERLNVCDTVVYDYLERSDSLVNASSPRAVQRKIDGSFMLLDLLQDEMKDIRDKGILDWYYRMIAHSVLSLLTMIAVYQYDQRKEYLIKLKRYDIFPLSTNRTSNKNVRKIKLINLCLILYLWLVHIKNK